MVDKIYTAPIAENITKYLNRVKSLFRYFSLPEFVFKKEEYRLNHNFSCFTVEISNYLENAPNFFYVRNDFLDCFNNICSLLGNSDLKFDQTCVILCTDSSKNSKVILKIFLF